MRGSPKDTVADGGGSGEARMNRCPEWHPMAVHFPLAFTVTGALALSAARVAAPERHGATLAMVGTWNLCLGAIGALVRPRRRDLPR